MCERTWTLPRFMHRRSQTLPPSQCLMLMGHLQWEFGAKTSGHPRRDWGRGGGGPLRHSNWGQLFRMGIGCRITAKDECQTKPVSRRRETDRLRSHSGPNYAAAVALADRQGLAPVQEMPSAVRPPIASWANSLQSTSARMAPSRAAGLAAVDRLAAISPDCQELYVGLNLVAGNPLLVAAGVDLTEPCSPRAPVQAVALEDARHAG